MEKMSMEITRTPASTIWHLEIASMSDGVISQRKLEKSKR
jgi:hypothetical protein